MRERNKPDTKYNGKCMYSIDRVQLTLYHLQEKKKREREKERSNNNNCTRTRWDDWSNSCICPKVNDTSVVHCQLVYSCVNHLVSVSSLLSLSALVSSIVARLWPHPKNVWRIFYLNFFRVTFATSHYSPPSLVFPLKLFLFYYWEKY